MSSQAEHQGPGQPRSPTPSPSPSPAATRRPSLAQSQSADLEAVIVTARKREETLLDIPQEIQAISQQQLERANLDSVEDFSRFVPSLTLQRGRAGPRHDLLPRRRRRFVLVHRRCLRRDLPRRAAAHAERAAAGDPARRHRAHRGAARTAGHAVRLELAGGDAALHHEQARPVAASTRTSSLDGHTVDDGDEGYEVSRRPQHAARRERRDPRRRLLGARRRLHRQRARHQPRRHLRQRRRSSKTTSTPSTTRAAARRCAGSRTRTGRWMAASSTSRWTPTATRKTTSSAPAASSRSCASRTRAATTNGRSSR